MCVLVGTLCRLTTSQSPCVYPGLPVRRCVQGGSLFCTAPCSRTSVIKVRFHLVFNDPVCFVRLVVTVVVAYRYRRITHFLRVCV